MNYSRFLPFVVLGLGFFAAACAPKSRFESPVASSSDADFQSWYGSAYSGSSETEKKELDEVMFQLKKEFARSKGKTQAKTPLEYLRTELEGKTLGDMIIRGLEAKKTSLVIDRDDVQFLIDADARLRTLPGDVEAENALKRLRSERAEKVANFNREIAAVDERLSEFKKSLAKK